MCADTTDPGNGEAVGTEGLPAPRHKVMVSFGATDDCGVLTYDGATLVEVVMPATTSAIGLLRELGSSGRWDFDRIGRPRFSREQ